MPRIFRIDSPILVAPGAVCITTPTTRSPAMANVLTSIDIAVSPERVWELVTDLQRLGE
jgi:hypothetical protein